MERGCQSASLSWRMSCVSVLSAFSHDAGGLVAVVVVAQADITLPAISGTSVIVIRFIGALLKL
jgi:hypothetical protein